MKKISICLDNNTIRLSYIYIDPTIINLEINHSIYKYIFSHDYIENNFDLFTNLIKNLINKRKVHIFNVEDDLFYLAIKIIKTIEVPMKLNILNERKINDSIVSLIIKAKYIKQFECYDIDLNCIDLLDKQKIKFFTRKKNIKKSDFTKDNNINSYSDLHNKEDIKIISNINNEYINDFNNFCKENKNLKNIYLYGFQNNNAEKFINNININNFRKLKINLYVDSNNLEIFKKSINNLKKLKKKYSKNKNINFEIVYSEEYYKKNYFKQLSLITLKACFLIGIVFGTISISIMLYNNFNSNNDMKRITKIMKTNTFKNDKIATISNNENENVNNKQELVEDFEKLLSINNQTIGWLKVNNTNVNLPIVQTDNNEYYLNNNFYKKRNINGWAFLDYRNNYKNLNKNTIIYGHNGTIFGSLKKTLSPTWYKNQDNQIITFNTLYKKMQFKIFAIYETTPDFYYIDTFFNTDSEFQQLINDILKKSYYNFNVDVSSKDKILTLSTCTKGGKKRIVIHAKLI